MSQRVCLATPATLVRLGSPFGFVRLCEQTTNQTKPQQRLIIRRQFTEETPRESNIHLPDSSEIGSMTDFGRYDLGPSLLQSQFKLGIVAVGKGETSKPVMDLTPPIHLKSNLLQAG